MRGRPREFERTAVLNKAMDVFWSQGYEATGMADLCSNMGLGRQSLYNAFGDKEALFAEALACYRDTRLLPVITLLKGEKAGVEAVNQVLDFWSQADATSTQRGCFMANSIAELGVRDGRFSAQLGKMLGEVEDAFSYSLERAREAGELSKGQDPRTLARLLTTLGQGLATVGKLDSTGAFQRDAIASARALLQ
jgi:TetR/AcrR family transcriptional repressor of nem operon